MDSRTFEALEMSTLIGLLAQKVQTPLGRLIVLELRPSVDRREIESDIAITTEAVSYLRTGARFGLGGIADPEPALAQLPIEGKALDPHQILVLEQLIAVALGLRDTFRQADLRERFPHLSRLASRIPDLSRVLSGIAKAATNVNAVSFDEEQPAMPQVLISFSLWKYGC